MVRPLICRESFIHLPTPLFAGTLMGSIHSLFTANELASTTMLDAIYSATVDTFASTVFLFMTGLYIVVLGLLL